MIPYKFLSQNAFYCIELNDAQNKINQEWWNTCNCCFTLSLTCCQTCQGRRLRMTLASTRSTCSDYRTRPRWSGMGPHCLWSRMPCKNSSIKNIKCNCYPETKSTWKILFEVHFTVKCWITEKKISPSIQSFQSILSLQNGGGGCKIK